MIANWIIIALIVAAIGFVLFRGQDFIFVAALVKKYMFGFIVGGIILFFVFSIYHVSLNYDVSLTSYQGILHAGKVYLVWLKSFFTNMVRVTGYAIGQDWLMTNSTG